ncbi:MAG: DEAD/DEAH box helicase family protein [Deltaproteobacteria bacterium]|nr:DEAD/DEAH box helicase family protein [Deltaproteobacteria bacterium]
MTTLSLLGLNLPAIQAAMTTVQSTLATGNASAMRSSVQTLRNLIEPLPGGAVYAEQLRRWSRGTTTRRAFDSESFERFLGKMERAIQIPKNGGLPAIARPRVNQSDASFVNSGDRDYIAHKYQKAFVRAAVQHFQRINRHEGQRPKRGLYRLDTGLGKSLTYAFMIQALMDAMPEFADMKFIIGSHMAVPAFDMAEQFASVFKSLKCIYLGGPDVTLSEISAARFLFGTYSQLNQEGTVGLMKDWVGSGRACFVLDEADLIVPKGMKLDENDQPIVGKWQANWQRLLIEMGLFDPQTAIYNLKTRHFMLGASATFDRKDRIPLSVMWGPDNVIAHMTMKDALRRKLMVPTLVVLQEMKAPPDARIEEFPQEFWRTTPQGRLELDEGAIRTAMRSDFAMKTAVRSYMEYALMKVGMKGEGRYVVRKGLGFAEDTEMLEKLLRWQQDLFALVESIFQIYISLHSSHPHNRDTLLKWMGGTESFGDELRRFLDYSEWEGVSQHWEAVAHELSKKSSDMKEVHRQLCPMIDELYKILRVEARKIQGRPLVATAAWQSMDYNQRTHRKIRHPTPSSVEDALRRYPNPRWPNRFANKRISTLALRSDNVNIEFSLYMRKRGFNWPHASIIIDTRYNIGSRRDAVQGLGRATRPYDGRNPTDHTLKPEAVYVTITPSMLLHKMDQSRLDVARAVGYEIDPDIGFTRINAHSDPHWMTRTEDPIQLDLAGSTQQSVVQLWERTAKELEKFLVGKFGKDFDLEVVAFNASIQGGSNTLLSIFRGRHVDLKERQVRNWLHRWGADNIEIAHVMSHYYADYAEMETVYGEALRALLRNGHR